MKQVYSGELTITSEYEGTFIELDGEELLALMDSDFPSWTDSDGWATRKNYGQVRITIETISREGRDEHTLDQNKRRPNLHEHDTNSSTIPRCNGRFWIAQCNCGWRTHGLCIRKYSVIEAAEEHLTRMDQLRTATE